METVELISSAFRDLLMIFVNGSVYSVLGSFILCFVMVKVCYRVFNVFLTPRRVTFGVCDSDQDMAGKTVLITGATAGIGRATAEDLARRNARVILACRNLQKAHSVAKEITSSTGNKEVIVQLLDLSSFKSVRECAERVLKTEDKLDVLINNAGIFASRERTTKDGCETVMQSNHLGHFLLTLLLLDLLRKVAPSRIINVASSSYPYGKLDVNDMIGKNIESDFALYSRSKLANVLFTRELSSRLANTGITVNTLCPGLVDTGIMLGKFSLLGLKAKLFMKLKGKTWEEGAQTTIYLAVHPEVQTTTGKYFTDCKERTIEGSATDVTLAKELFEASEKIVEVSFK